jgi:hypothetical protein
MLATLFGIARGEIAVGLVEAISLHLMGTVLSNLYGSLQNSIILAPFLFHHSLTYKASITS